MARWIQSENFPASLRKIFRRERDHEDNPTLVSEGRSHGNLDSGNGGSGNDGFTEEWALSDETTIESGLKCEELIQPDASSIRSSTEKFEGITENIETSQTSEELLADFEVELNPDIPSIPEQCGAKLKASRISAETGKKVKDALQKGREFLKRKFSDYQHKLKSKWDGGSRLSLSSSSEANDEENLTDAGLKKNSSSSNCHMYNGMAEEMAAPDGASMTEELLREDVADGENGHAGLLEDNTEDPTGGGLPVENGDNISPRGVGDGTPLLPQPDNDASNSYHGNQSFDQRPAEDDLQLGEEGFAMSFNSPMSDLSDDFVVVAISMMRSEDSFGKSPSVHSVSSKASLGELLPQDSVQSDLTQTSQSTVSSVEALLEDRKVDPEQILTNLGFRTVTDDENFCRIPMRFLQQTSGATGIDVENFLEEHEDLAQLVTAWQQQQYGVVKNWNFVNTVSNAQAFVNIVQKSAIQRNATLTPSGDNEKIIPNSVLHPANQHALASQGYYDDWDANNAASESPKSSESAKRKRKQVKPLSADHKRRLFRTSHKSWNLVEEEESDGDSPWMSHSTTGDMASSGSRMTFSMDSSTDGSLSPFWNIETRKNSDPRSASEKTQTSQRKVLGFLFPDDSKDSGHHEDSDLEFWYTPPSSPEPKISKNTWSSSTLLDESLCTSVGDDSVFEEVLGHGDTCKGHGNEVLKPSNEISEDTNSVSENQSEDSLDICIRPIISTSKDQLKLSRKKSVSFKDDEEISEVASLQEVLVKNDDVENVIIQNNFADRQNPVSDLNVQTQSVSEINSGLEPMRDENFIESATAKTEADFVLEYEEMAKDSDPNFTQNCFEIVPNVSGISEEYEEMGKGKELNLTKNSLEIVPNVSEIPEEYEEMSKPNVTQNSSEIVTNVSEIKDDNETLVSGYTCTHDSERLPETESNIAITVQNDNIPDPSIILENQGWNSEKSEIVNVHGLKMPKRLTRQTSFLEESELPEGKPWPLDSSVVLERTVEQNTDEDKSVVHPAAQEIGENQFDTNSCHGYQYDLQQCTVCEQNAVQAYQSEDRNNNSSDPIGYEDFKSDQLQQEGIAVEKPDFIGLEDANGSSSSQPEDRTESIPDLVSLGRHLGSSGVSLPGSEPTAVSRLTSAANMVCGHSVEGVSIGDGSWMSPIHPPERRRLLFLSTNDSPSHDEVLPTSAIMSPDILLQLTSDQNRDSQSVSASPLARTSSAQSDSSGFADLEPDNMLDLAMSKVNSIMGSSCESDITWASSVNTVLPHSTDELMDLIGQNTDFMSLSPGVDEPTPASSTEDKCIGTDIQGLDLIFQVLTPSGEVYHPSQGEDTLDNQDSDAVLEGSSSRWTNDLVHGFSEKSCRFHESSYCIIPTLYGSDFGINSESWSAGSPQNAANDLNGNPTPQKKLISKFYMDISPRCKAEAENDVDIDEEQEADKSETSMVSLKLKNGHFRTPESCGSSDSSGTTKLQNSDKPRSLRDELSDFDMEQEDRDSYEVQSESPHHEDRSLPVEEEADYSLCNFSHVHETCEASPVGMSTPKTGPRVALSSLPFCRRELSTVNLNSCPSPYSNLHISQCQAASTPEVTGQRPHEVEAAIFEYQKLASLINQPSTKRRPGLGAVTTPRYSGPTHSDKWRALRQDQRLSEETRLMQQAIDRYKMELRHLETSFNAHYSKVYDMMTEEERDEIEELQLLRAEVYKEVCETERLMLSRSLHLSGKRPDTLPPLASLDVVHQMIELLKEQMYQRTVVLDLDSSMDHILDTSSSSLALSPWEEEVSDLKEELRWEQRQQQRVLEKSFEDLKISLLDEVRSEFQAGTQSLYQELQTKDQKINALQTEVRHLRRRSLQAEMRPPR